MKLTTTDLITIAALVLATIVMAYRDDPRIGRWIREAWSNTVGAWFARRRFVGKFNERRHKLFRIDNPDEHSKGIMVMRRDVSAGWWS